MARDSKDDLQRRRLRNVYEQNRRRVTAVANARDRNRRSDDESAPRQFVVTERRTRREGFGRGGAQTRQVSRRRNDDGRRPRRFADRNVSRRGDRFERDEDRDRERRRFRRNGRDGGRQGNKNQRLSRRNGNRRGEGARGRGGNGGKNLDDQLDQYKGGKANGNSNGERRQRQRGGERGAGGNRGPITKESLDAQLLAFKQSIATTNAAAQQTSNFPSI